MYAIIELGGRQWKVEPGTRLEVNRVQAAVGGEVPVERILFAQDGQQTHVGRPYLAGAKVICEVLEHRLGPKVISYYFRRRENWRKTVGHRQPLSRLVVKDILVAGASGADAASEPSAAAPVKARAPRAAAAAAKPAAKKTAARKTTTKKKA